MGVLDLAATKVGTALIDKTMSKGFDLLLKFLENYYKDYALMAGKVFTAYINNAKSYYSSVKTLINPGSPVALEGEKGIYTEVFCENYKKKILVSTLSDILGFGNNLIIIASGGSGKSLLTRHLFVQSINEENYLPVIVELRKAYNDQSIYNMICSSINGFDASLNDEQLCKCLESGVFVLLFDGLDEVKEESRNTIENEIQELAKKYPKNKYIITSRPHGINLFELETFEEIEICPLEVRQSLKLIRKIPENDEKKEAFCTELEKLYYEYKEFASNPLLLTIMFLTFKESMAIPEHISDFYEEAFSCMYNRHDASKSGGFKRVYQSSLGKGEFRSLFSYLCADSYLHENYDFDNDYALKTIENGIIKLELREKDILAEAFLSDVINNTCLIIQEGLEYRFIHRSFQTYFSAVYTAQCIIDSKQSQLAEYLLGRESYQEYFEYFSFLYNLDHGKFYHNVLNSSLINIYNEIKGNDPLFSLLTRMFDSIYYRTLPLEIAKERGIPDIDPEDKGDIHLILNGVSYKNTYETHLLLLFSHIRGLEIKNPLHQTERFEFVKLLWRSNCLEAINSRNVKLDILKMKQDMDEDNNKLLEYIYRYYGIDILLSELEKWYTQEYNEPVASDSFVTLLSDIF